MARFERKRPGPRFERKPAGGVVFEAGSALVAGARAAYAAAAVVVAEAKDMALDAISDATAIARSSQAAAQSSAADADAAVLLAQQAQAAALEIPGESIDSVQSNPLSESVKKRGTLAPATIDHAGVQAALDSAATFGLRVQAAGAYTTNQTLAITSDADLSGLTITYTGTGTAVRVGKLVGATQRLTVTCPRVIHSSTTGGWAGAVGAIGVHLINLYSCPSIQVPYVRGFEDGLLEEGRGIGCVHNNIVIGHLDNNKRNHRLTADATGWVNQNTHMGGRLSHNSGEGVSVAGTRQIVLDQAANPINTNTWIGPSLEGNVAEFHVDMAGTANVILNGRYEVTGGARVRWRNASGRNAILFGYMAHALTETFEAGVGAGNQIIANSRWNLTASTPSLLTLENSTSSDTAVLTVMAAGAQTGGSSPATAYTWKLAASKFGGKRSTDTYNRLEFDPTVGRVLIGQGIAAPAFGMNGTYGSAGVWWSGVLAPTPTNTYDMGASAAQWRDVHVGRHIRLGSLYLRDNAGVLQVSTNGTSWQNVTLT